MRLKFKQGMLWPMDPENGRAWMIWPLWSKPPILEKSSRTILKAKLIPVVNSWKREEEWLF